MLLGSLGERGVVVERLQLDPFSERRCASLKEGSDDGRLLGENNDSYSMSTARSRPQFTLWTQLQTALLQARGLTGIL